MALAFSFEDDSSNFNLDPIWLGADSERRQLILDNLEEAMAAAEAYEAELRRNEMLCYLAILGSEFDDSDPIDEGPSETELENDRFFEHVPGRVPPDAAELADKYRDAASLTLDEIVDLRRLAAPADVHISTMPEVQNGMEIRLPQPMGEPVVREEPRTVRGELMRFLGFSH